MVVELEVMVSKPGSRAFAEHDPGRERFLHLCGFIGTNPRDELITYEYSVTKIEELLVRDSWVKGDKMKR
jgi:hypothetical protein